MAGEPAQLPTKRRRISEALRLQEGYDGAVRVYARFGLQHHQELGAKGAVLLDWQCRVRCSYLLHR